MKSGDLADGMRELMRNREKVNARLKKRMPEWDGQSFDYKIQPIWKEEWDKEMAEQDEAAKRQPPPLPDQED